CRGALLSGDNVEHGITAHSRDCTIHRDIPHFVECRLWLWAAEIDMTQTRLERGLLGTAADVFDLLELDGAGTVAHVPEVRMAALELRLGPCEKDAVLMRMIVGIIVGHDSAIRREYRMHVSGAKEIRADAGVRRLRAQKKIEYRPAVCLDMQRGGIGN